MKARCLHGCLLGIDRYEIRLIQVSLYSVQNGAKEKASKASAMHARARGVGRGGELEGGGAFNDRIQIREIVAPLRITRHHVFCTHSTHLANLLKQ